MRFYDAHNHLQDDRFGGCQAELITECQRLGVARMVVNGSGEADWPQVAALAAAHPGLVIPSFGHHPWHVGERTENWGATLERHLDHTPRAVIGEIGLDRWKPGLSYAGQEDVFVRQLRLAADRNLPASIHCLQTWGRLLDLLRGNPRPARGFLLHSYGGPLELVAPLVQLGAYFSFPGYYLHERKVRQRETFRLVPPNRLLIETDAPDQLPPAAWITHSLPTLEGSGPLNHPANLPVVYRGFAAFTGEHLESLAARVEENFQRLFGE